MCHSFHLNCGSGYNKAVTPPSKSRRRLLIGLGLLGLAGALFQPAHKLLEVRRGTKTWTEKWQRPPKVKNEPGKLPALEHANRLPARIENDLTLKQADSPWIIDHDVMIPAGVTLTIEAGSEILSGRKHYITVEGRVSYMRRQHGPRVHSEMCERCAQLSSRKLCVKTA